MSPTKRFTKRPMTEYAGFRIPEADKDRWFAASKLLGVSQSEFLRVALRERAERVLAGVGRGEGR